MYHADIECNFRSFCSKLDYNFRPNTPTNPSTPCTHTLLISNCQDSLSQPHTTSLRTEGPNLSSELYTASLGGGEALAPVANY